MDQDKVSFLAGAIKNAKAVMQKVEGNNFTPRPGGGRVVTEEDVDRMLDADEAEFLTEMPAPGAMPARSNAHMMQNNIKKSKMPQAILESFMESPAIDPTQPFGTELLMNQIAQQAMGGQRRAQPQQPQQIQEHRQTHQVPQQVAPAPSGGLQLDTKLVEYIVKKAVEETLAQMNKQTSVNENFRIVIGDKVFSGKLTTLNETKKPAVKK